MLSSPPTSTLFRLRLSLVVRRYRTWPTTLADVKRYGVSSAGTREDVEASARIDLMCSASPGKSLTLGRLMGLPWARHTARLSLVRAEMTSRSHSATPENTVLMRFPPGVEVWPPGRRGKARRGLLGKRRPGGSRPRIGGEHPEHLYAPLALGIGPSRRGRRLLLHGGPTS